MSKFPKSQLTCGTKEMSNPLYHRIYKLYLFGCEDSRAARRESAAPAALRSLVVAHVQRDSCNGCVNATAVFVNGCVNATAVFM